MIEGAYLLGRFPREVAENLSIRELLALVARKDREEAARLRSLMKIIYHSAIAPNSKEAVSWIRETDKRMEKESR